MNILRIIFFLFTFTSPLFLLGQIRVSEDEVNIQKVFIEANREKILGNYEDAAFLYKEVLKRDQDNHAAAYELARIYDVLDNDDKALSSIKMAIALDKDNEWYQMFLADVYEKMSKFKPAAQIYEELLKKDPNLEYYYAKWAFYLVKAKLPGEAIKAYDKMEEKTGITEDISLKKHRLHLGMGNQKKAAAELEKLANAYPSITDYRLQLAGYYDQIGDNNRAETEYLKILEREPDNPKAKIAMAGSLKESGHDVSYLQSLKTIFEKPDVEIDLKVKELIPFISKVAEANDPELAATGLELTQLLKEVHPKEAKAYSAHGDLLYHSGKTKEAQVDYEKAVTLDNSVFAIWEQLMYIDVELNNSEALLKHSNDAIDVFPNQAKAYYFNGIANSAQGDQKEAINVFRQSLLMSRKKPRLQFDILSRLGQIHHSLKEYDKSDSAFEDAMKINPKDYNLLNTFSYALAQRGAKLDKAKEMSGLANELNPNQANAQHIYAWVLYKMREYPAAKDWLSKALSNGGDKIPDINEHYGDVLFHLGKEAEAIEYWEKALQLGSTNDILNKKITDRKLYE